MIDVDFYVNFYKAINLEYSKNQLYFMPHIMLRKYISNYTLTYYEIDKKLSTSLSNAVKSSKTIDELILKVENILIQRIEDNRRINLNILSAINKIKLTSGTMPIKKFAESECISERHLNRIFEQTIGLSPKMFSRLVRINKAIKIYKTNNILNSTYITYDSGFFDQSHLIREFYQFCGTTPSNFVKNMSDFYNEPFKF